LNSSDRHLRIGIIAGEASGDILGSGLIEAIQKRYPTAQFEGIAGPRMIRAGCWPLYPGDVIAVMGIFEVLRHLPRILRTRRELLQRFLVDPPDLVIGIDSPDFNLDLELKLREAGIRTAHYVSPSVWAWRQKRVFKIARAVDLMLALFPFEAQFYRDHKVPVVCVGHPLAEMIPDKLDVAGIRAELGLDPNRPTVALLPGSRMGEVSRLGGVFLQAAAKLAAERPELQFVAPMASNKLAVHFSALIEQLAPDVDLTLIDGQSREVMGAADAIMLASGTATLEATLLRKPMVVAYRMAWLTWALLKLTGIIKAKRISLPNLLADADLVPELIQQDANPERLAKELSKALDDTVYREMLQAQFETIHHDLRKDASEQAAQAVLKVIDA